jgi:hypothetical protein
MFSDSFRNIERFERNWMDENEMEGNPATVTLIAVVEKSNRARWFSWLFG